VVLPIGDAPNPRGVAWVTSALIAVNVAVFLLVTVPLANEPVDLHDPRYAAYVDAIRQSLPDPTLLPTMLQGTSAYDLYVFTHGFRPAAMSLEDLLTSMFLHGGLLHLVGNMLFLWIYGDNVEHHLGPTRYLAAYLGTGTVATLSHALIDPSSMLPMVGASGAISGVLGFYFVWFPRNHVRLLWLLPPFVMQVMLVPARIVLGVYLVLDNLLPMVASGSTGGVAHAAHIGGFIAGALCAVVGGRWSLRAAPAGVRDADDAIERAHALEAEGDPRAALALLQRHLREFPRGPQAADVHARAGRILLEEIGDSTAAYQHFAAALDRRPSPQADALARQGLAVIAHAQKRQVGRPFRLG
jgi:membrane associated rhomboid family serine protease